MEDYFVIILTLIIAVVGALNSRKKKAANKTPSATEHNQPSDLWDMIMNQEEEIEEDFVPEYAEPEPVAERLETPEIQPMYTFTASSEGKSDISEVMKTKVKEKKKVLIDGEEFSLKKAVIYNEIMNRKYS